MLELFKRNGSAPHAGVLFNIIKQSAVKSKYGCHLLLITGVDREIGNIITFGVGLCSHITQTTLWWLLDQFMTRIALTKRPLKNVFAPLDKVLFPLLLKHYSKECNVIATHHSIVELV